MIAKLLLGDEAIARGAIDAGIAGAFSYPGTPATEIFEHIARGPGSTGQVSARWAANEKVAYEDALGMSYAGRRALVSMKHVGLNVPADPFVNSALTGINAGLVLVVADDPGMHSSQNEQDSRFYAEFAQLPLFEPATQQEAYDLTRRAFDYSEAIGIDAARGHLAASIYVQMALHPHIVHIVGHTEADHAATADDVIEAAGMARRDRPAH